MSPPSSSLPPPRNCPLLFPRCLASIGSAYMHMHTSPSVNPRPPSLPCLPAVVGQPVLTSGEDSTDQPSYRSRTSQIFLDNVSSLSRCRCSWLAQITQTICQCFSEVHHVLLHLLSACGTTVLTLPGQS